MLHLTPPAWVWCYPLLITQPHAGLAGPGASPLGKQKQPLAFSSSVTLSLGQTCPILSSQYWSHGLAQVMVVLQVRWRSTALSFSCRRACETALQRHWPEVPSHTRSHPPCTGKCYFSLVAPCLAWGKLPPSLRGLGFMLGGRKRTLWKSY